MCLLSNNEYVIKIYLIYKNNKNLFLYTIYTTQKLKLKLSSKFVFMY